MTHVLFSIRTLLFAFVMLASALIVRPVIGDPEAPVKVEAPVAVAEAEPAEAVRSESPEEVTREVPEAVDYLALAERADSVFVGQIVSAFKVLHHGVDGVPRAYAEYEVDVLVGLKEASASDRFVFRLAAGEANRDLATRIGRLQQEAFFFLQRGENGSYVLHGDEIGIVPVEGGKLFDGGSPQSAKSLARNIALSAGGAKVR